MNKIKWGSLKDVNGLNIMLLYVYTHIIKGDKIVPIFYSKSNCCGRRLSQFGVASGHNI